MRRAVRALRARPSLGVLGGLTLLLLAVVPPGTASGDSTSMLAVGDSLARGAGFAIDCETPGARPGRGGACFSNFYPLNSVLAAPFIAVGRSLGTMAGVSAEFAGRVPAFVIPALSVAVVGAVVFDLAGRLGASPRRAVLVALGATFSTELLTYSRSFFAEPLVAALLAIAVWGLTTAGSGDRRRSAFALAAVGLVVLAKPQAGPLGFGLALLAIARGEPRVGLGLAGATLAGATVMGAYNALRYGSVLEFGGADRDVEASSLAPDALAEAAALLLVSPGRGLLFFAPLAVVGMAGLWRVRRTYIAQAAVVGAVAASAIYLTNTGIAYNWGTRYLAPAMPMLVLGAATLRSRPAWRLAVVAGLIGLAINLPNVAAFYQRFHAERATVGAIPAQVHWSLADGQLLGVWGSAARQVEAGLARPVDDLVRQAGASGSLRPRDAPLLNVVALWWWILPAAGIPLWFGAALFLGSVLAGAALLVLASKARPRDPTSSA